MLAVMFFSLMIGVGVCLTRTRPRRLEEAIRACRRHHAPDPMVISCAPLGVGARSSRSPRSSATRSDPARYVGVVLALATISSASIRWPCASWAAWAADLLQGHQAAMITAFSTASSNATLPTALQAEDELKLPNRISRFVLTIGSTATRWHRALRGRDRALPGPVLRHRARALRQPGRSCWSSASWLASAPPASRARSR